MSHPEGDESRMGLLFRKGDIVRIERHMAEALDGRKGNALCTGSRLGGIPRGRVIQSSREDGIEFTLVRCRYCAWNTTIATGSPHSTFRRTFKIPPTE